MRGADTFTESLFTLRRLEDFVPEQHPLRPIRDMVNQALKEIEPLLSSMYAADVKGGAPAFPRRSSYGRCCCKSSTAFARNDS